MLKKNTNTIPLTLFIFKSLSFYPFSRFLSPSMALHGWVYLLVKLSPSALLTKYCSQFISFCLPSFLSFPEYRSLFVFLLFNLNFYLTVCLTLSLSLPEYRSFFLLSASDTFHLVKNINFVLILFYDIQYEYFLTSLIWPVSKQNVFHFVKFLTIY